MKLFGRRVLLFFALLVPMPAAASPALIPMPVSMVPRDGEFRIAADTIVDGTGAAGPTAAYLSKALKLNFGGRGRSRIRLRLISAKILPGPEAYHLSVTPGGILIEASDPRGLFYGAQTLRQLATLNPAGIPTAGCVDIHDTPRFSWRGLLIDLGRHFFGKQTLFRITDEMAFYKLNVLHLHLTDDPGWRLEIPGYPKLTETAVATDGSRQYFTAEEMREIVAYAAERHIMVVPEIEMPSHAGSAARAYPELFNGGSAFDPAKPETYSFIRAILSQVAHLFPAPYIHFGGDEVAADAWNNVEDVARLKVERGLKSSADVGAYFGHNVSAIITGLGKRPMAWDEQMEADASKDMVIQWWRKGRPDVLSAAANAGHELVMSPVDQVYFDYHQGPGEPGAPWEGNDNGPTSIAKILAWEPVPDSFTPEQSGHVLGVEAAVWTEFIESERYLEFMTFPRLLAFAEVAWRPRGARDEKDFEARLQPQLDALRARGINARRGEWDAYEFITN